jgi:Fe-S oxidoreductase
LLKSIGFSPKIIADRLLENDISDELVAAIQRCSLCGFCSGNCPHQLNPAELMQAARARLISEGRIEVSDYRLMLVDEPTHFFHLYRDTWRITYQDLDKKNCPNLFFPGCSLAGYAPELTRAAWNWLTGQGLTVGLSVGCCGLPLQNIGLVKRAKVHLTALRDDLHARGIEQIIVACPNCYYFLRTHFDGFRVISLYQLLNDAGVSVSGHATVAVHDACPDRFSGEIGRCVRALLQDEMIEELPHHGAKTQCCGAGGIVSMVDPEVSTVRARKRLNEIQRSTAEFCVSACMACVKRLNGVETGTGTTETGVPGEACPGIKHILELVFNQNIDHEKLDLRLKTMWKGEHGARNLQRLNASEPNFCDTPTS